MSKYISEYATTLLRFDDPFAYVTLTDFGENKGLLQIHSDWGTYSYYWGSMGGDIISFLADTSASYVHTKLQSTINYMSMKVEARGRLDRFMIQCWPDIHVEIKRRAAERKPADESEGM